ncbi:hypothetical protein KC19_5G189000 [Ceratodon purpureus]|uniref:Uncharacterized protein n=1 Tax=Ceratodon purpureus TaxID=3225 RepID=A0A8T0I4B0_CERPU|nr:hypothetical protein KC19_5G189000 [Ceratodon purpureus]
MTCKNIDEVPSMSHNHRGCVCSRLQYGSIRVNHPRPGRSPHLKTTKGFRNSYRGRPNLCNCLLLLQHLRAHHRYFIDDPHFCTAPLLSIRLLPHSAEIFRRPWNANACCTINYLFLKEDIPNSRKETVKADMQPQ